MSLEPWNKDSLLVRFEHLFEENEDSEYSKPVKFNFENVFKDYDINKIQEVTLSANQWIEDANRLKFRKDPDTSEKRYNPKTVNPSAYEKFISVARHKPLKFDENFEVTLSPMEIRTFIVTLNQSI